MRGFTLAACLLLFSSACLTQAQIATDVNEGLQVFPGTTPGDFALTWWGKAGRTYFVRQSSDMVSWQYLPLAETGVEAVSGMNFSLSAPRQFWHLVYTDIPVPTGLNAWTSDFDGDGVSNHDEVFATVATDPFLRDTDWDGFTDAEEITAGTNPTGGDSAPAAPRAYRPVEPGQHLPQRYPAGIFGKGHDRPLYPGHPK